MKEIKDSDGKIIVVPGSTKYFDVGRLLVDQYMVDEYRRILIKDKLIKYFGLQKNFHVGKPINEYYDGILKSLKTVQQNNFDELEILKWVFIDVMIDDDEDDE